jgi:hypothetical protein
VLLRPDVIAAVGATRFTRAALLARAADAEMPEGTAPATEGAQPVERVATTARVAAAPRPVTPEGPLPITLPQAAAFFARPHADPLR